MSNKLFIFSGGWYCKCTLLLSVLTHRQKCKNVINFNNCQGFCGHHSTITTRWLSQLSTFTYSRVHSHSKLLPEKTRNMDLSLSEFLVFLFSKKPQFLKTFSICVHFCRLAPIYFGGWGDDKRIALFRNKTCPVPFYCYFQLFRLWLFHFCSTAPHENGFPETVLFRFVILTTVSWRLTYLMIPMSKHTLGRIWIHASIWPNSRIISITCNSAALYHRQRTFLVMTPKAHLICAIFQNCYAVTLLAF